MRLLLLTVVCVVTVSAYDFNDEVYNHYVRDDIEDYQHHEEHLINYRTKRQEPKPVVDPVPTTAGSPTVQTAPTTSPTNQPSSATAQTSGDKCKKRKFRSCCGEEIVDRMLEKDKDMKKECYKEVMMQSSKDEKPFGGMDPFSCEKMNKTKKEWTCVMQCVGQKKNVLDENGNIKEKELLAQYKKDFSTDDWFLKMVEAAFPKCMEQIKTVNFTKNKDDPLSCSPVPTKMHHCMWRELQLTCPENKITDQKMCSKIREKIKKHEDLMPLRHLHHDDDK